MGDQFFAWIGKAMTVAALIVVLILVGYAIGRLYKADQSYQHDTTPLLAPDSTRKVPK